MDHGHFKKQTLWKSRLKKLLFDQFHMKDNFKMIHFHVKRRCVQGLIFVQVTFEKCTTNCLKLQSWY